MEFTPGQSTLHRLHPVAKVVWLMWATMAVFLFDAVALPLVAVVVAVAILWGLGVRPWRVPGLRLWLVLGLAILIAHAWAVREGDPVLGPITTGGLVAGGRSAGRVLAIILFSALFVVTTEPFSLACGLMSVGLPYRWGFALVTALRLVPIFKLEAHHVYQAQMVRGVAYDATGPRRWWLMLRHLCLPLLVSALRTAHALSLSMEGRGFGLHTRRTFSRQIPVTHLDLIAVVLLALSIAAAVWLACRSV